MSIYKGQWSDDAPRKLTAPQVTVDGQPLPAFDIPGAGQVFGWGNFGPWANQKLLAYSILLYELSDVMGLARPDAYRYTIDLADFFVEEHTTKLDKQWSMTSDEIGEWLKQRHSTMWEQINRRKAGV